MKAGDIILVTFFGIGLIASMLLGCWLLGLCMYVFGDSPDMGAIAKMPKIIFLFVPFVFLYKNKRIDKIMEEIVNNF